MRTRHIEVLQAILRTGTISGAARLLHVSQPAVTKALQHAEATVGFALFNREGKRLVATKETHALAPVVEQATGGLDAVRELARNLKLGADKAVRVAAVASLANSVLPSAVLAARKLFPKMRSELNTGHTEDMMQKLLMHEVDLAIAFDPPLHPSLDCVEIGHLQLVAASLPARLGKYARNKSISAEALATMELIELSGKDPLGRIYSRYANRFNWQQGKTAVRTYQMAVRLAELDQGVAIVDSASANFFSDKLKVLPLEPRAEFPVCAMYLKAAAVTDIMRALTQCVSDELQKVQDATWQPRT